MDKVSVTFRVYFENPFWVGIFEKVSNGKLSAHKLTFGAEPNMKDIAHAILRDFQNLDFSPFVEANIRERPWNPKRAQREARKQMDNVAAGTKSQQALQLQREQKRTESKRKSSEEKEAEKKRIYELKCQKRRKKHKGK